MKKKRDELAFPPGIGKADEAAAWDRYFAAMLPVVGTGTRYMLPSGEFFPRNVEYQRPLEEMVAIAAAIADIGVRERRRRYR